MRSKIKFKSRFADKISDFHRNRANELTGLLIVSIVITDALPAFSAGKRSFLVWLIFFILFFFGRKSSNDFSQLVRRERKSQVFSNSSHKQAVIFH